MPDFNAAIAVVLQHEGSAYVPDDAGQGPSKYGILLKTYRGLFSNATSQDIQNLTEGQAVEFYRSQFWVLYHVGFIDDQTLATKVLDLLVNVGPIVIRWLQKVVGVPIDGVLGTKTACAVNVLPPAQVLQALQATAASYYKSIAAENPELYAADLPEWLARLAS
jgi:lysozyme family protein